jgi:hypothetical protein
MPRAGHATPDRTDHSTADVRIGQIDVFVVAEPHHTEPDRAGVPGDPLASRHHLASRHYLRTL